MNDQRISFGKRFLALVAFEGFDAGVNVQVLGEGQPFSEPLRTVGACVRSDIEMLAKMCVQRFI